MTTSKLSILEKDILTTCAEVEQTVATLYRSFAKIYAENQMAVKLFQKTANEEDDHANQFMLACRMQGAGMKCVKVDAKQINDVHEKLRRTIDSIQANPPELKKALEFSANLEVTLGEYHMNAIVEFEDESLRRLFTNMRNNDRDHAQALRTALAEL